MTKARTRMSLTRTRVDAGDQVQSIINRASSEINSGHLEAAASLIRDAVNRIPESSELHTVAALLCLRTGDNAAAEIHLLKAMQLSPNNKDVVHNLALLYWGQGKAMATRDMLQRLVDIDPGDADSLNDLAVFEDQCGNSSAATIAYKAATILPGATRKVFENCFEFLLRCGDLATFRSTIGAYISRYGDDEVVHRWQREAAANPQAVASAITTPAPVTQQSARVHGLKIAFFAAFQTFLEPIMNELKNENEVRLFSSGNEAELKAMLEWCDLAWFEWCDNLVIAASRMPKRCKIICRLHSYEVFTEMPSQVDWSKIDHLVLVNRSVQELLRRSSDPKVPISIIHNGVDTRKFDIPANKKYGKRICSIGYINYKKNPALLLYCFKAIHNYDSGYRFHIAGAHQDPRIQIYFEHLLPKLNLPISFDGWVTDMPAYLRDKDYVISTSLFESFHYSIAEGMASGLTPLIHDWLGASYLYPDKFLFTTPEDCVGLLQRLEREDRATVGRQCREHIVKCFDETAQLAKIQSLIQVAMEGAV